MGGPSPAVADVRRAVREWLTTYLPVGDELTVAVSGGGDSLALASATLFETRSSPIRVHAVTVDHGLQAGSADRAAVVARWLSDAGASSVRVERVEVGRDGGPEAAARNARYAALAATARGPILLGHTLDDQAETVLLGLARGSGPRSLAGMRPWRAPYGRPLLGVRRSQTRQYCADLGIEVWDDPHNDDARYTRVRLRHEVLPLLDDVLGGKVAEALARTAQQLREVEDSEWAGGVLELVCDGDAQGRPLDARRLGALRDGLRRQVIKAWLDRQPCQPVSAVHVEAVDRLVADWHGQGPAYLPGGAKALRTRGKIQYAGPDSEGRAAPHLRQTEE